MVRRLLLCCLLLVAAAPAEATSYVRMGLHERVQMSDTIVLARVVDPARALVTVERVLKGQSAKQVTLSSYIDNFAIPAQRKVLVLNALELLFLRKQDETYAPVQDQYGRLAVQGDRLIDSSAAEPLSLSQTLASIERLVAFQARAAGSDAEADAAYVAALKNADPELRMWALCTAKDRIKVPSPALADALLASWPTAKEVGPCSVRGMQRVWWPIRWSPGGCNERHRSSRGFSRLLQAAMSVPGPRWRWEALETAHICLCFGAWRQMTHTLRHARLRTTESCTCSDLIRSETFDSVRRTLTRR